MQKKEHWLVFSLGDVEYRFNLSTDDLPALLDDLSTIMEEEQQLFWFNHSTKGYERVDIYSETK